MIDRILHGDCLAVLAEMPDAFVELVYMDPPFFTQKVQLLKSRELTEYRFADRWPSLQDYLNFLRERFLEVRRVMKDHATIFVHCDRNASHYIRVLLDEVFGYEHFLSEIIWTYRRWSNTQKGLLPSHQTILMYAKSDTYTFNPMFQPYSETTNLDQILQKRERDENGKTVYAVDEDGSTLLNGPKKGVPLSDTWAIPYLNPKAKERTGYPTQKPLLLLERIIELSSNPGDIVLDPFCGSGTTCVAAKLLNRHYLGIDASADAVQLSLQRLAAPVRSDSERLHKGAEAYQNLPADVLAILQNLPVQPVQRNKGIDAIHNQYINGRPVVLRVQRQGETLAEAAYLLESAGRKKQARLMFLIRTEQTDQTAFLDFASKSVIVIDSLTFTLEQHLQQAVLNPSAPL
ncbi:MAG: DNA methyltransferase [bacterium]|nr:DNA methyltransferase [bacterium]